MKLQHQNIALAIRIALVLGSGTLATVAAAQDNATPPPATTGQATQGNTPQSSTATPQQNNSKTLQTVTVTGSLIRSVDVETAQPVTAITHEALQQQGFVSVGQILQNVPSVGSSGTSTQSSLGGIVGQYASLRGLGAPRTLILVDGERYTTDIFGQTDLSTIPSSLIDSVDILQDGASSIYGSDAIAGVINIHTKNVNGLYLDTYNSTYSPGNYGKQSQFSLTGGHKFSRGSFTFNISIQNLNQIMANQTWFSKNGYFSFPEYPQSVQASNYGTILGATGPAGSAYTFPLTVNAGQNGQNIANYHPNTFGVIYPTPYYSNDYANQAAYETLIPNNRLKSYTLKGDYKITDNIKAVFTGTYNSNDATDYIGGYPLSSLTPANGANLAKALGLPAGSLGAAWFPMLSPNSYYNPLPGNTLAFSLPLYEPNRYTVNNIKQYGFRTGLEGEFTLGENEFNWNAGYSLYRYIQDMGGPGNLNLVHLYNAIGPSFLASNGQVECGTPTNVIAGCVPLNPFSGSGGLTPAELNYLNYNYFTHSWSQTRNIEANLSGDMFTLPQSIGAGDVTFAVGGDHRDISGGVTPDFYTQQGINTNLQQNPGRGSYGINEAYAEINIPLLKDLPGAQLLNFDVSHRFSHYSNFGDTNNNSYKLSWQPITDLLVRASYGTGFRAPSISNLYGGTMQSFTNYTDPCDINFGLTANPVVAQRCLNGFAGLPAVGPGFTQLTTTGVPVTGPNTTSTTPYYTGANAALKPETSKNYTAGIVYSPSWLTGFNVTLDAYRIRVDNIITLPSADSILSNCYLLGETQQCSQFQRSATNGQVINLLQALVNEGFVDERGTDVTLSYLFPDTPVGKFKIDTSGTYISSLKEQAVTGGPVVGYNVGTYDPILGPVWRFRDTTNINWSWGNFGATWTVRYFSALKEPCRPDATNLQEYFPCNNPNSYVQGQLGAYRQGALAFNDLQFSWKAPWHGQISVGATNVFNRRAPLSYNGTFSVIGPLGPTGTDGYSQFPYNPQYDFARVVYLKYEQKLF
ncbi:TonB-dependent receptor plug domain-containing protein [Dyella nitratireducens]|uniref:TonB-dependent receptor n=1 Tax=Dyella nitratireducens TaxID=1849580 RepID=A0ABQ1FRM9_9GAMM|nr:TonB-dependent receptor [Dyella nitratireducens]GGA26935.1 TonB-dependent receptor [Dyella nitratireducens]GLQ43486.1 TonB-dependent receptor [Dyella nitratireducens]